MNHKRGAFMRPRHYKSPESFDKAVDKFIKERQSKELPVTWTGLALAMGFADRTCIDHYATYKGFSHSVKRAKALVQDAYEMRLHGNSPTGAIFALKCMGMREDLPTAPGKDESTTISFEVVSGKD